MIATKIKVTCGFSEFYFVTEAQTNITKERQSLVRQEMDKALRVVAKTLQKRKRKFCDTATRNSHR